MQKTFSPSSLNCFEKCPKQYWFRYVAKVPVETEGIEAFVGKRVHEVLERLYQFVAEDMVPSIERVVYMKYYGQLDDVEVVSPVSDLNSLGNWEALVKDFEDLFAKMFTLAARPDVGAYHINEVCVIAKVDTVKPVLRSYPLADPAPADPGRLARLAAQIWSK